MILFQKKGLGLERRSIKKVFNTFKMIIKINYEKIKKININYVKF